MLVRVSIFVNSNFLSYKVWLFYAKLNHASRHQYWILLGFCFVSASIAGTWSISWLNTFFHPLISSTAPVPRGTTEHYATLTLALLGILERPKVHSSSASVTYGEGRAYNDTHFVGSDWFLADCYPSIYCRSLVRQTRQRTNALIQQFKSAEWTFVLDQTSCRSVRHCIRSLIYR